MGTDDRDPVETVDTGNKFLVSARFGSGDDSVCILRPPIATQRLSLTDAINLAAWLVALVPDGEERFARVLRAVMGT